MMDSSSLIVQIHGFNTNLIVLKGPPGLFPTADIPEALPPLSSYTEATVRGDKVDTISMCGAEPLVQYNNSIIRRKAPGGSAANAAPAKENAPAVPPPDPKAVVSRQVLSLAMQGNYQGIFKYLAPEADKAAIAAMVNSFSGQKSLVGLLQNRSGCNPSS